RLSLFRSLHRRLPVQERLRGRAGPAHGDQCRPHLAWVPDRLSRPDPGVRQEEPAGGEPRPLTAADAVPASHRRLTATPAGPSPPPFRPAGDRSPADRPPIAAPATPAPDRSRTSGSTRRACWRWRRTPA